MVKHVCIDGSTPAKLSVFGYFRPVHRIFTAVGAINRP